MNVCIVLSKVGAPKHGYYHWTDVIILSRSLSLGYIVFYGGHLQHETQASSPFNLEL